MELTKISDTVVKTTETKVIETEVTKDGLLDKIANIENQIVWLNLRIEELNIEKTEVELLLVEINKLGVITKAEWNLANPVIWTWDLIK